MTGSSSTVSANNSGSAGASESVSGSLGLSAAGVGLNPGDEHYWDCSVCTFRNHAEAFKCSMCDVRKGTSTRSGFRQIYSLYAIIFDIIAKIHHLC